MYKDRKLYVVEIFGIILGLLWLTPFYMMIVNAFKSKKEIFTNVLGLPESLSMENFVDAFIDLNFVNSLFNSLLITGISVTIIIIFSSMAGYALARSEEHTSELQSRGH